MADQERDEPSLELEMPRLRLRRPRGRRRDKAEPEAPAAPPAAPAVEPDGGGTSTVPAPETVEEPPPPPVEPEQPAAGGGRSTVLTTTTVEEPPAPPVAPEQPAAGGERSTVLTTTTVEEPPPPPVEPEPVEPEPAPRAPRAPRQLPQPPAWAAVVVTGLIVGLVVVGLTWASLRACESVQGTSTCGTAGYPMLALVVVLAVLVGALLLRLAQVPDPVSTSVLGVGVAAVLALVFLIDHLDQPAMVVVIPLICAATFAGSHWLTTAVIEPGDG